MQDVPKLSRSIARVDTKESGAAWPERAGTGAAPAARRAYAEVKERLLDGRFAGGTLLSENEIAQRLGLSRTPVRQAFVQLEAEGLLELYPRRGALVVPVSASEADDVLEARLLIEQHAARRAAAAPPADEMRAAAADQEAAPAAAGGALFRARPRLHHPTSAAARHP